MKPLPRARALLAALCLSALAPRASAQELAVPFETHTLPNGLRVVLSPERTAPTVAVVVYYDVGSRVEERGRTGYAHLFEHLMFEGSASVPRGEHFRLVGRYGGDANGNTSEDRTVYYETLPAAALSLGLFLEADRMRALDVSQPVFDNQRQTVMEERRQSYDNQPYANSLLRLDELAYGDYFPYAHSVIGDMADLQRAPLSEVRAFHERWYAPSNAVLVVAGGFEPERAMTLVQQHFGALPRREAPVWTSPPYEPAATSAERTATVRDPLAELPAVHFAWVIPARRTPDHYALEMLASVLGDGESARLQRSLVRERELVNQIAVTTADRRGPDMFTVTAVVASSHTPAQVRAAVTDALRDFNARGLTMAELERARNHVRAVFLFGIQSPLQRALQLGEFELMDGNAGLLRTELDRYLSVSLDDVRRVARQYLRPERRVVLEVQPGAAEAAQ